MQRLRLIFIVLAVAALAGCASNQRNDTLTDTLNAYQSALRWNGFQQALGFVDPEYLREHPLTELERQRYAQVRVAGYDEGGGPVPVADDEVHQSVRISLINRNTQQERDVIDEQIWKWDAKAGHWWLTTGLPDITQHPAGGN